jgi:hypothetical protein
MPPPVARLRTLVELTIPDGEASPRVELGLALMTGTTRDHVHALAARSQFGLVGHLGEEELHSLYSALSSIGVRFRRSNISPSAGQYTLRFKPSARFMARVATVAAVAVTTAAMGVPAVSWLGLPVAGLLVWDVTARVPDLLELSLSFVEEKLGAVDRAVWNELAVSRRSIKGPEAAAAAQRCATSLCSVIEQLRSAGAHLIRADFANLDYDAHALLRRSFRLAAAADRVTLACEQRGLPAARLARLTTARRELFAALDTIEQKLDALRVSLVELSGLEAHNEGLAAAMTRVTEIQVAVETGLELSALAVEEPRSSRPSK